jgi:hypothetical protein
VVDVRSFLGFTRVTQFLLIFDLHKLLIVQKLGPSNVEKHLQLRSDDVADFTCFRAIQELRLFITVENTQVGLFAESLKEL